MTVFEFIYNPCIYESGDISISLHFSKKGAYKAMKEHKLLEYERWRNNKYKNFRLSCIFGRGERWGIKETKILP